MYKDFSWVYNRRDSLTSVLLDTCLPSFNKGLHNSSASFVKCVSSCSNQIVSLLNALLISSLVIVLVVDCQLHFLCLSVCLSVFACFIAVFFCTVCIVLWVLS